MISVKEVQSKFSDLISGVEGDITRTFTKVGSFENATESTLVFLHNDKLLNAFQTCNFKIGIVNEKLAASISVDPNKTYIFAKKSDVLVAKILSAYFAVPANPSVQRGIHPTCVIDPSSSIHPEVTIAPHVVIGKNVTIEAGVSIGPNTFIGDHSVIQMNACIDANNYLGPHTIIGKHVRVQAQNTLGAEPFCQRAGGVVRAATSGVCLQDNVEIGAGNVIERGFTNPTTICVGTKLDNRIFIGSESIIGPHSFLTAGLRIAHNVTTGHHFVCGGGTMIEANIHITDMVQVAGISCVNKDITKPGAYGGYPIQNMRDYLRTVMTMTKIADLRKEVSKLLSEHEK